MKKKYIIILVSLCFLLTGCTKYLSDNDNKRVINEETLVKIGLEFGNRDHSTVIHACDKIAEDINTNGKLKDDIENIKNKIVN